jgi:hypothetical protein
VKLRTMLQNVPDPRGKQGQDYFLWSILGLIVVSLLCGRRGMLAAFHLGIAVGTLIAKRPPRRSVLAEFPHTAPTSGV